MHSIFDFISYNTLIVLIGTTLLGASSGFIGVFLILRKRTLAGDAIAHSTLPGIALFYILFASYITNETKLLIFLSGGLLTSLIALFLIHVIDLKTRLYPDSIIGSILSSFFGFGLLLFSYIQYHPQGQAAGINHFIFGQTAGLQLFDVKIIAGMSFLSLVICIFCFKELVLLCFDPIFCRASGFKTNKIDFILHLLICLIMIIGLQTVGALLILALLIIPASAARFFTDKMPMLNYIAGFFGACSAICGTIASTLIDRMPTGAVIALFAFCFFISGLLISQLRQRRQRAG